jgi:hypothetical protein
MRKSVLYATLLLPPKGIGNHEKRELDAVGRSAAQVSLQLEMVKLCSLDTARGPAAFWERSANLSDMVGTMEKAVG